MLSKHPGLKSLLVSAMLAAVACGLALLITRSSVAAGDIELWAYDFLVNHGGYARAADNIVVVDFDNRTIDATGRFPVPRGVLAKVLEGVALGKPRVLGLDFFLSEIRDRPEDQALQDALTHAGNVIVASQLHWGSIPKLEPQVFFCQPEASAQRGFCQDGTPGALGFAFVNVPLDNDGYVRSTMLLPVDPNDPVAFPVAIAQQYSGEAIKTGGHDAAQFLGRKVPYADPGWKTALISWSPTPAQTVSALDILQGTVDAQKVFADKIVLLGQSSDAARDRFFTPLFRPRGPGGSRLLLPGVQLHAAAIHTLLQGPVVSVISQRVTWPVIFLLVFLAAWVTLRFPVRYAFIAVLAMMGGLYAGAQLLFSTGHLWIRFVGGEAAMVLVLPLSFTYQFVQERFGRSQAEADRKQMMGMFERYVSPAVANQIWERRDEFVLAGEERVATVLFTDIRSFTAESAGKPSREVLRWLNEYFTAMDEVITREHGFLNKFIGDGLMILFGVPLSQGEKEDACAALRAALAMLARLDQLNASLILDGKPAPIHIGVGMHTGVLTCGNVGSKNRLEYSVIGQTVNLASRLESLTKDLKVPIVMTAETEKLIRGCDANVLDLGEHKVRGFDEPLHLFGVTAPTAMESALGIQK
jgi:class 3 adenylate cyclase/CHASE2 domain-containing sensor protein